MGSRPKGGRISPNLNKLNNTLTRFFGHLYQLMLTNSPDWSLFFSCTFVKIKLKYSVILAWRPRNDQFLSKYHYQIISLAFIDDRLMRWMDKYNYMHTLYFKLYIRSVHAHVSSWWLILSYLHVFGCYFITWSCVLYQDSNWEYHHRHPEINCFVA